MEMVKRSNKHVWVGLGFVATAVGIAGAAYFGMKSAAEPTARASDSPVAVADAAIEPNSTPTAPSFDPSVFNVSGVWQLSDNYNNSWCGLGIYHIDADGTYWVDRGWQNDEFGSDEGRWTIKAPDARSQKGVKAVIVFTPKQRLGTEPYRFEILTSERFRFSAFGFDDGDGPTGENVRRIEFEQISNQTVLDAFAQDCGTKPGEGSEIEQGQT